MAVYRPPPKYPPWLVVGGIVLAVLIVFWFVRIPGPRPVTLGVANGKFAPCRESPNCVNSQALDGKHSIAPIPETIQPGPSR